MRCLKPNAFPICDWCEYRCWAPFTTVFLMNAHPCFRAFCSFSMSPLSLIVADYRYQVHFSTPRFAGVSKTTRHGEYGKQRWNTVVNGAQHRYLHQSQIGNAFGFKHRIEWAQHWILRCSAPFPTVLGIVPDGAHFSSTVGNGAEVFPCITHRKRSRAPGTVSRAAFKMRKRRRNSDQGLRDLLRSTLYGPRQGAVQCSSPAGKFAPLMKARKSATSKRSWLPLVRGVTPARVRPSWRFLRFLALANPLTSV